MKKVVLLAFVLLSISKTGSSLICRQLLTTQKISLTAFDANAKKPQFSEFAAQISLKDKNLWRLRNPTDQNYNLATIEGQQPILNFLKRIDKPSRIHYPRLRILRRCAVASAIWYGMYATFCPGTPHIDLLGGFVIFNVGAMQLSVPLFQNFNEDSFLERIRNILSGHETLNENGYLFFDYDRSFGRGAVGLLFGRLKDDEYVLHVVLWNE